MRTLLPALREAARTRGVADIIVIGSVASDVAFEHAAVYVATAAARNALGEQLRVDRVRSRTMAIGFVETSATEGREIPAVTEGIAASPLHPEDVAEIVHHELNLPAGVTVRDIEVVPTSQGWA